MYKCWLRDMGALSHQMRHQRLLFAGLCRPHVVSRESTLYWTIRQCGSTRPRLRLYHRDSHNGDNDIMSALLVEIFLLCDAQLVIGWLRPYIYIYIYMFIGLPHSKIHLLEYHSFFFSFSVFACFLRVNRRLYLDYLHGLKTRKM